ncbi:MAG: YfhO family protein [Bacteroidetes bacterium]|nr:YfhO family protein [Bacteroidota bacterium]
MKDFFSRNWKHFICIAIILIVVMSYFKLQFQDYGLKQHDVQQWLGMAHEISDYRDELGEETLWTNSMFGGMPSVQISIVYSGNYLKNIFSVVTDLFPLPMGAVLISMIGFYFMALMLGVSPWIALIGSLAYGFTTYDIIILQAGHNTKAMAISLMAPALGAFIMAYRRNLLWGIALTGVFMTLQIGANHLQVTYYFAILLVFVGLAFLIEAILSKKVTKFIITSVSLIAAIGIAVLINYGNIALTNEYAKYTIRGGNDITINPDGSPNTISSEGGLDKDYITQWSYGKGESFTLLSPNVKGGGSFAIGGSTFEGAVDNVEMTSQERNVVLGSPAYWGQQPFTSGPVYIGIIVVFLALLGMVFLNGWLKWGLLLASILALMLSWGKNYMGLTDFFIENVPGYNKFRTVTIILVIIQLTIPLLGVLVLQKLYQERENLESQKKKFLITTGLFVLVLLIVAGVGLGDNYTSERDESQIANVEQNIYNQIIQMDAATLQSQYNINKNNPQEVQSFISAQAEPYLAGFDKLKEVRKEIFSKSMWRSILFTLFAAGLMALFFYSKVKAEYIFLGLGVLILIDLVPVANNYLGNQEEGNGYKYWEEKGLSLYPVQSSPANETILNQEINENPALQAIIDKATRNGKQKAEELDLNGVAKQRAIDSYKFAALNRNTNYRVFDFNGGFSSSEASYFHKSLGGYHGAKLRNIQNMFDFHLSKSNNKVYDMMNVKYFIQNSEQGPVARPNPTALGNAWFVKEVSSVNTPNEEILSLGSTFEVNNVGSGTLLVNSEAVKSGKVFGSEKIDYVLGKDTLSVGLTNGMQEGMEAYFCRDINGQTNLIPAQILDADPTESFTKLVGLKLLNEFKPSQEAVLLVDESKGLAKKYTGSGFIKMSKYNPSKMEYISESSEKQLAIFSEVYYPINWKAFVDGKEVEIRKANYLLRAIEIPAGKHKIEMRYSSELYKKSSIISALLSSVLIGFVLILAYLNLRKSIKKEV